MMKKAIILLLPILLLLLTGCWWEEYIYEFDQPMENIEKVEIMTYDESSGETTLLKELNKEEYTALLQSLQGMTCKNSLATE